MSRIGRRAFTAGGLSLAACGGAPPADGGAGAPSDPEATGAPAASTGEAPENGGAAGVFTPIVGLSGVGPVVWSWTTSAQIAELARGDALFSRDTSATLGEGLLFTVMRQRTEAVVARVAERLRVGRFGWFNPWSASRGFEAGETYGGELIRMVVAPDALFMVVSSAWSRSDPVTFADVAGNPVGGEVANGALDRVVGIYFTHDAPYARACRGTGSRGGASPYREVYLGNEARIASFSARSEIVARDLARADAALAELGRRKYSDGGDFCAWSESVVRDAWTAAPTTIVGRYLASLAFPTEAYVPTRENLTAIRAALAAVPILPPGVER